MILLKIRTSFVRGSQFSNHESTRINTSKMSIKAEREGSGAPECQQRKIKIAVQARLQRLFIYSALFAKRMAPSQPSVLY